MRIKQLQKVFLKFQIDVAENVDFKLFFWLAFRISIAENSPPK